MAKRITEVVKIDGNLNDAAWTNANVATDFIQFQWKWNEPSQFKTEVKLLYDNTALYIGAYMYDPQPDSIMQELSQRDNLGSADFVAR